MNLRVVHVVESMRQEVGNTVISLDGLVGALQVNGIESRIITEYARANADIAHIHGWGYPAAVDTARSARAGNLRYVISPQGNLCRQAWFTRLRQRGLLRGASCVLALNDGEARELRDAGIHRCLQVLPYGLDFAEYEAREQAAGVRESDSLLMMGTLHPRGGCVALLKALAELGPHADRLQVIIAAKDEGDWRPMLEAAVRRKGAEARVRFVTPADLDSQKKLLASASMVVVPTLQRDFSLSIMQAAASGVPVVATTCVAPPGLNGAIRVCEPRRDDLRAALQSLLSLPPVARAAAGQQLRSAARAVLDWSVLAPRWAEMYRQIT
jgi:glycosyltransferase involved in cell wall biosynthesis